MSKKQQKLKTQSRLASIVMRIGVIFLLALALPACVTTSGGAFSAKQENRMARKSCTPVNESGSTSGPAANKEGDASEPKTDCLPLGIIEIYENASIDSEVREEFAKAVALLKQENYSDAIKLLKAVSGKTSKFSAPYINLGMAYARIGELAKAEESFKQALEINQQHPVTQNELGMIYRKTGRYSEARKLYESLLTMYPDFLPGRKNLGVLCDIYLQDLECALQNYEEYLKGVPGDEKVAIWITDVKSRI